MLEAHYYANPIFGFFGASAANPSILIDAEIDDTSTVIDAGAFIGEWVVQITDRYSPTVYAFEPGPGMFDRLQAAVDGRPDVHPFAYGLGREDAHARLALDGPGSAIVAGASATGGDQAGAGSMGVVDVEIRDVAAVFDELGLDHVDLLKLNIEGGEYDVLDRLAETGWLGRIDQILVQFHEWHPHAHRRRRAIRRALRQHHVERWNYPWVWELWAQAEG